MLRFREIIGRQPVGDLTALDGVVRLRLHCLGGAKGITRLCALKGRVEGTNHRVTQRPAIGRFQRQKLDHVLAPILVMRALAGVAHTMRLAKDGRQVLGIAQVFLAAKRQFLCAGSACGPGHNKASQQETEDKGMHECLCHATTFARIEAGLKRFDAQIRPLVIHDDKSLTAPWGGDAPAEPQPQIVYATQDIYFSKAVGRFFEILTGNDRLDWFQSSAAGIEHPVLRAIGAKAGAYTSSHEQSASIAEWVAWAGLDFFQGGPERRAAQAAKDWKRMAFREIAGTHWLVVGFGHIGQESAKRLRALGAHVTGVRRSGGSHLDADAMITPDRLPVALPEADAVLLSLPLTDETEGLADAAFFAAMKPGSLFTNVGRGKLVDEAALLDGLAAGRPAHATLDVVAEEPLPAESPIWSHPQVTLTPHISALTEAAKQRTDALFLENLQRYLAGDMLRNLVPRTEFL